jgi:hypothetical protein
VKLTVARLDLAKVVAVEPPDLSSHRRPPRAGGVPKSPLVLTTGPGFGTAQAANTGCRRGFRLFAPIFGSFCGVYSRLGSPIAGARPVFGPPRAGGVPKSPPVLTTGPGFGTAQAANTGCRRGFRLFAPIFGSFCGVYSRLGSPIAGARPVFGPPRAGGVPKSPPVLTTGPGFGTAQVANTVCVGGDLGSVIDFSRYPPCQNVDRFGRTETGRDPLSRQVGVRDEGGYLVIFDRGTTPLTASAGPVCGRRSNRSTFGGHGTPPTDVRTCTFTCFVAVSRPRFPDVSLSLGARGSDQPTSGPCQNEVRIRRREF